jgi:N-acetylneuraminate lyase
MKFRRLTGLVAAVFTPMRADGSLNAEAVAPMTERLIAEGVAGLYVNGSTGEGPSLTSEERRRNAEAFVKAAARRVPVIVQVGHNSPAEARALAAHAQAVGADAVSATPPSYFKPASTDALVRCMAEIAGGAPNLPFYYYHIPTVTGVSADMPDFLRRAADRIPSLAGIKYTAPTLHEYQACVDLDDGRFDILFGTDEMLLPALSVGARGAVGSTYNFAAPLYLRLLAAFGRGDLAEARRCQSLAVAVVRVFAAKRPLPAQKAIMGMVGLDCGPVRLPLETLTPGDAAELRAGLEAAGFFERAR